MKAVNLKTEYLKNPLGIDVQKLRLMWTCDGGKKQTAYRIVAVSNGATVWDSEKVMSDAMYAEYPKTLKSRQRVEWSVTLWDENDKEGETASAFFETGLLSAVDFTAKWITGNYRPKKSRRYPVDCFKKSFNAICVQKARLYISACGLYEAKLNGKRIGEFIFAPGSTDYRKRIQYQTYDVTDLIISGNNDFTVELADGWYRGSIGAKGRTNTYGKQTKLYAQLELVGSDGKITAVYTDGTWAWSQDGAIEFADLKDGERVNANKVPSYKGKAKVVSFAANLTASNNVQVKERERFLPLNSLLRRRAKRY